MDENVPKRINIDKGKLKQVIISILGIAFRYAYQGFIFLRISYRNGMLRIKLNDEGVGLPLFINPSKLYFGLTENDKTFCDSGINMVASELIVTSMGGTMKVNARKNIGTKINISIPILSETRSSLITEFNKHIFSSGKILHNVPRFGYHSRTNTSIQSSQDPWNFPLESTNESTPTNISIPIFHTNTFTTRKKPLPRSHQSSKVVPTKFLTKESFHQASTKAIREHQKLLKCNCPRVLVVDDNALNLFVIEGILKRFGVVCNKAFNGSEAIKMVTMGNNCVSCRGYDIIFMDCNMPIMNGFEASKQLILMMMNRKIRTIPIIANSAFSEEFCLPQCKESGISAFSNFINK